MNINEIKLYSVVKFKEHGHCGLTVEGVVVNINGETLIIHDYEDNEWILDVKNIISCKDQFKKSV